LQGPRDAGGEDCREVRGVSKKKDKAATAVLKLPILVLVPSEKTMEIPLLVPTKPTMMLKIPILILVPIEKTMMLKILILILILIPPYTTSKKLRLGQINRASILFHGKGMDPMMIHGSPPQIYQPMQ
jgi:hypothetical protein